MKKNTVVKIIRLLKEEYPTAGCELTHRTPYELLVATILSAQCTDVRVNIITSELFQTANTPEQITELGYDRLEEIIRTCGLSKTKAKNIIATSRILLNEYGSAVPKDFDSLTKLPGVGRKTANVVLSNAFGIPAIAVDTHVFRVSNRIGLADAKDVLQTENQLMKAVPKDSWSIAHHVIIWHGRRVCNARVPKCYACVLKEICKYPEKNLQIFGNSK